MNSVTILTDINKIPSKWNFISNENLKKIKKQVKQINERKKNNNNNK